MPYSLTKVENGKTIRIFTYEKPIEGHFDKIEKVFDFEPKKYDYVLTIDDMHTILFYKGLLRPVYSEKK